jgi:ATP-dependent exoDNAse (exonuclease V) alpha subunit
MPRAQTPKFVAVGDERQLQSVAAGGAFRTLVEREGARTLRQVLRQRDPAHRRALAALREGCPQEYLRWQVGGGRLEVGSRDEVCAAAVTEWADAQANLPWGQAALVARSNELREELNLRARGEASARGWLGPERLEIAGREYRIGERVVARRNDRVLDADNGDRARSRESITSERRSRCAPTTAAGWSSRTSTWSMAGSNAPMR